MTPALVIDISVVWARILKIVRGIGPIMQLVSHGNFMIIYLLSHHKSIEFTTAYFDNIPFSYYAIDTSLSFVLDKIKSSFL